MTIKFTIQGNQNNQYGNSVPKIKKTRNSYWTSEAQRYKEWKEYVVFAFLNSLAENAELYEKVYAKHGKPILLPSDQKARMDLKIYWADETHADPENVFGSIADALFFHDKHIAGSFDFEHEAGKGRVEVEIKI